MSKSITNILDYVINTCGHLGVTEMIIYITKRYDFDITNDVVEYLIFNNHQ